MCQIQNHCRLVKGPVVSIPTPLEVHIAAEEEEVPLEDGPVSSEEQEIVSPEEEPAPTDGTDTVEPEDPYKGLTKEQLVELLKEKE